LSSAIQSSSREHQRRVKPRGFDDVTARVRAVTRALPDPRNGTGPWNGMMPPERCVESLVESRLAALRDAPASAWSPDEMKCRLRERHGK
jgi:hypothetical protein